MESSAKRYLNHIFHVDLSDQFHGEDYWLDVAGTKHMLLQHTEETLSLLKSSPKLKAMPGGQLTHYAQAVPMPLGSVMRISVRHTNRTGKIPGDFGVHAVSIHVTGDHEENQLLASSGGSLVAEEPIDYVSTAKSLLFHHADLITANKDVAPIVMEHMDQFKAPATYMKIQKLAMDMRRMGPPTKTTGWANYEDFDAGKDGIKQTLIPTDAVINLAGASMTSVQISTKNDLRLKNKSWTQETGTSVVDGGVRTPELLGTLSINDVGGSWTAAVASDKQSNGLHTAISIQDAGARKVKVTMKNYYIRWLASYVQFIDANGKTMKTPTWQPDDGGVVSAIMEALNLNYDDMRCIGWVSPINTVLAIPIFSDPGLLEVVITFPEGAVSANLFGCGLGTGNNQYPKTPVIGGVFTGLANLGIPAFMLGFGVAAQSYKPLYKLMGNPTFVKAVVALGVVFFGGNFIYNGAVNKKMDWKSFSTLSQILFNKAATEALVWCEKEVAGGVLANEIPFAGWIMLAINIATTLAQMAQTIVQVATSPWMIPNSISTTITSTMTVFPDPRSKAFPRPPQGTIPSYVTKLIYRDQNRPTLASPSVTLDPDKYPSSLTASYTNTLGGQVKFQVDFYLGNWLAGTASTTWLDNDQQHAENITLYLFQQPIPLDDKSIYKHTSMLGYNGKEYAWMKGDTPPKGTLQNSDTSQSGNAISLWTGLALSQRHGVIGISWKAAGTGLIDCSTGTGGQLYALQTVNIPGTGMKSVQLSGCGFSGMSQLIFDVYPPKFKMENGTFVIDPKTKLPVPDPTDISLGDYYIDPRKANNSQDTDGGYHLRKVVLDPSTPFNMNPNQNSYGRFPFFPDSMTLHPSGHAIAVNSLNCKMMITPLVPGNGLADDNLPLALTFAGQALDYQGSDGRAGLLFTPIAITSSYDGTILVLEQLRSQEINIARAQAFDLNGNPVNAFKDADGNPSPFLSLPGDVTYLDIVAVGDKFTTYVYVLSYKGNGYNINDYSMALYECGTEAPQGNLLVVSPTVPAAKINVNMWHTMYTLNYQMTQNANGDAAGPNFGGPNTGPAGVTVPSVSEWLPPLPS